MNNEKFFTNKECKYFPCHKLDEDRFNCLFCYCPLYFLGDKCGGNFTVSSTGKKSCINCSFPHNPDNYDKIMSKLKDNPVLLNNTGE